MNFLEQVKSGNLVGANPFGGTKEINNPFAKSPISNMETPMQSPVSTPASAPAPVSAPTPAPTTGMVPNAPMGMPRPMGIPTPSPIATPVETPVIEQQKEEVVQVVEPTVEQVSEPTVEQVKEEPVAETVQPTEAAEKVVTENKTTTPSFLAKVAQTVAEKKVETKTSEVTTETIVQDIKTTDAETTTIEDKKEEAPKKRTTKKSTSRAKKKTEEVKIPEDNEETIINTLFTFPKSSISYVEAIKAIDNAYVDEEWEKYRASLIEESDNILIEADMTEGALKKTIAQLNTLREKVWIAFNDIKHYYTTLSNKDVEGIIERIKYANYEGSNEIARKKAGVLAVMNYKDEQGNKINYYEIYDETKKRYIFLKSMMDTIQFKSDSLITMSASIKLEKGQTYRQ